MKWCKVCNQWRNLADFDAAGARTRACKIHGPNAKPWRPPVRKASPDGERKKFEQVRARIDTGETIRFACERVGVDPVAFEFWLERRLDGEREIARGTLPDALKERSG